MKNCGWYCQGRTGAKKPPRAKGFIQGHRNIAEKVFIPLKMYLKSLVILGKASTSKQNLHFAGNVFKNPRYVYKNLILI
jgi:hypothetical protein